MSVRERANAFGCPQAHTGPHANKKENEEATETSDPEKGGKGELGVIDDESDALGPSMKEIATPTVAILADEPAKPSTRLSLRTAWKVIRSRPHVTLWTLTCLILLLVPSMVGLFIARDNEIVSAQNKGPTKIAAQRLANGHCPENLKYFPGGPVMTSGGLGLVGFGELDKSFSNMSWDIRNFAGNYDLKAGNYNLKAGNYDLKAGNYNFKAGNYNFKAGNYNFKAGNYNFKAGNYNFKAGNYNFKAENYNFKAGNYNFKAGNYTFKAGNYNFKAGNYNFKAGNYNFKAGNYNFKAGNYNFKAGNYNFKAGNYNFKAGNYNFKAGNYNFKAGNYNLKAGNCNFKAGNYN
eukprot:gene29338-8892_t